MSANLRAPVGMTLEDHAHVAALLENVDAEAAQAGDAVSHVQLGALLELPASARLVIMLKAMESISSGVTRLTSPVCGTRMPSMRT